jgi:hypothetical protein
MFKWLDQLSLEIILIPAIILGLAPFRPEPHLWEKLKMLAAGTLSKPIDIFDLIMHGSGLILLVIWLVRKKLIKTT